MTLVPATFTHGASAYVRRGCRCRVCTKANRLRCAARRQRSYEERQLIHGRLVAMNPNLRHGTDSAYVNHGCRCTECTKAGQARNAANRARRNASAQSREEQP